MKNLTFASLALVILASCTETPVPTETLVLPTSTQAPIRSTSTVPSTTEAPQVVASTPTPTQFSTSSMEGSFQAMHWYWVIKTETNSLYTINELGDKNELGSLKISDTGSYQGFSISDERVILFTLEGGKLEAYLLNLEGMEQIQLPPGLYWDAFTSLSSFCLAAIYSDQVVFTYATRQSVGGDVNSYPDNGPIILMNLTTKTSSLLDTAANRDVYSPGFNDPRRWFHQSEDQRYLRYIDGSAEQDKRLREVDLLSGQVRTVYTTKGSPYRMLASPEGDLWYFPSGKIIMDVKGAQISFDDTTEYFFPLGDGKGLALQRSCLMDCEIRLFAPFEGGSSVSYRLPWSSSSTFYPEMSRVTSNQDLLFVGKPMGTYDDPTYLSSFYPEMNPYEAPLFRLTSDGKSQLIGTYIDDIGYSNFPLSRDGRYYILGSVEQDRFLLYDALENIVLSELPKKPGLDYFYTNVAFLPAGMIINQVASTTDKYYQTFYHVYSLESGETYHWEVPKNEFYECSDYLASNALICLRYDLISNSQDLVRFDLDLQEATTLIEKVNSIVFTTQ